MFSAPAPIIQNCLGPESTALVDIWWQSRNKGFSLAYLISKRYSRKEICSRVDKNKSVFTSTLSLFEQTSGLRLQSIFKCSTGKSKSLVVRTTASCDNSIITLTCLFTKLCPTAIASPANCCS